jgi:hypothetical protein
MARLCLQSPIMAREVKMPLSEPRGSSKPSNARPFDAHHGIASELPIVAIEWIKRSIEDTDEEVVACGIPAFVRDFAFNTQGLAATYASVALRFSLDTLH